VAGAPGVAHGAFFSPFGSIRTVRPAGTGPGRLEHPEKTPGCPGARHCLHRGRDRLHPQHLFQELHRDRHRAKHHPAHPGAGQGTGKSAGRLPRGHSCPGQSAHVPGAVAAVHAVLGRQSGASLHRGRLCRRASRRPIHSAQRRRHRGGGAQAGAGPDPARPPGRPAQGGGAQTRRGHPGRPRRRLLSAHGLERFPRAVQSGRVAARDARGRPDRRPDRLSRAVPGRPQPAQSAFPLQFARLAPARLRPGHGKPAEPVRGRSRLDSLPIRRHGPARRRAVRGFGPNRHGRGSRPPRL